LFLLYAIFRAGSGSSRQKRVRSEIFETSLGRSFKRSRSRFETENGSEAGNDSEEEVNLLPCEWDECQESFEDLKSLAEHVALHVDNDLPIVSMDDDESLGSVSTKIFLGRIIFILIKTCIKSSQHFLSFGLLNPKPHVWKMTIDSLLTIFFPGQVIISASN
jgi:hypothetical protein